MSKTNEGVHFAPPPNETPIHTAVVADMSKKPIAFTNPRATPNDEKKMRRRRSIIQEFSLNTSTHGLPGIARSESVHNRVFWTISFVCFTGVMIYFVTTAIINYFNYPTQFDLNVIREWPQYFPAVSICNASPFRLDRLIQPFFNYTRSRNKSTPSNASTIPPSLIMELGDFIIEQLNTNAALEQYLFDISSMLYTCQYNSMPCTAADFIQFTSASYGLCYTFNAKMKNSSAQKVRYGNANGGDGILELELYTHNHQSIPYFVKGKDRRD